MIKKYVVLSILSLLPILAHADASQIKTYRCDDGITLSIQYHARYADSLQIEGSDGSDGFYLPLGDGFGFERDSDRQLLFLGMDLYSLQDTGTLNLGSERVKCTD